MPAELSAPKGQYLDTEELRELGLVRERIDEGAYPMLEQYCVLQRLRRGEDPFLVQAA